MNEVKITNLKDLVLVHRVALNNDYIPSQSEIDLERIFDDEIEVKDKEQADRLTTLFKSYEGWSPSDLEDEIFALINKL